MAALATMQSRGGGRIPTATGSLVLSRCDLERVMRQIAEQQYPHLTYGRALARLQSDPHAAHLIREAAATYTTAH